MSAAKSIRTTLSPLLYFPGIIFSGLARMRNAAYTRGLFKEKALAAPVVSIGNLTLGGAGKTPLVILTAKCLLELGWTPALLSRGYGRENPSTRHILSPGNEIPSPARNLGDEPALVRRKVPEIWLGISADRHEVGSDIISRRSNLAFILDDGFQHRRLARDLDVLVVDASQPLKGNRTIPFGTLREPLSSFRRAHVVIVNSGSTLESHDELEHVIRLHNKSAPILHCVQRISGFIRYEDWNDKTPRPAPPAFRSAHLVAAIGNPMRFMTDIRRFGIRITGSSFFRDHHRISPREWDRCMMEAAGDGAEAVVTTEKDAVRVRRVLSSPLTVAVQAVELLETEEYREILARVVEEHR